MIRSRQCERTLLNVVTFFAGLLVSAAPPLQAQTTEDLQRTFTDLRFGMFLHFSIMTFTGAAWATPNQDVSKFNPAALDCGQWADAAVAAKMKFGILTTKHHDGFCLWNSAYTTNDVASSPWKGGQGDVVREYVDAFRARGLEPCLYYSIWDNTQGVGNGAITPAQMDFISGQITELLTNYGDIPMLFIDGWSWKMGHVAVPYDVIRALVKRLQPHCLLVDNTHLQCLYENDLIHFEAGITCPANNTLPALQSALINKNSGDDWFWDPRVPTASLMTVTEIVQNALQYLEPKWCTFVLNCPPNRNGTLDSNIVARLRDVGQAWSPDTTRSPLPAQAAFIENPVIPASASATSGTPANAIDALNDRYYYSIWQSSASLPQSITIDLGRDISDVAILTYVPKYVTVATPTTQGSIQSYRISTSTNGTAFGEVASGTWDGSSQMKVASFAPTDARYVRLEALSALNGYAAATEIALGRASNPNGVTASGGMTIPGNFVLRQNYPNPFNPVTHIEFDLPKESFVTLSVFDILGREVAMLLRESAHAGIHTVQWNAEGIPSGVYFCRLQAGSFTQTRKMLLVR